MSTHTQGKLTAETYSGGGFDLCIDGAGTIGGGALVVASRSKHSSRPDEMHANAARLVQCWNEYDELKAQRDELLAALKVAEKYLRPRVECSGTEGRTIVLPAIRAAIARSEVKP